MNLGLSINYLKLEGEISNFLQSFKPYKIRYDRALSPDFLLCVINGHLLSPLINLFKLFADTMIIESVGQQLDKVALIVDLLIN